ncbi:hypothetical protein OTU49_006530 [Cherax quadricarinatus]
MSRASGAPRRVCFAYSVASAPGAAHTLTLTARHDTCIQRQHDAHIALNATLAGKCMEVGSMSSGSSSNRSKGPAGGLHLATTLLLLLLLILVVPATALSL